MRGLLIGRFQPFHEGHQYLVDRIAEEVDEVIVAIGSAEQSHTGENPFTAGERLQMVHDVLEPVEESTYVVQVRDVDRNAVWVSHVRTLCPSFDVAYTNNPFVARLFDEEGIATRGTPLRRREEYRGTEIRRRMRAGEDWTHLVPSPVAAVVDEIDGVERLKRVAQTDDPRSSERES